MKTTFTALTIAASLGIAATANAWLGDSREALTQRYGKPMLTQLTTGEVPTQKGYYAELKENFSTNASLIAWTGTNYDEVGYGMDLVETRSRTLFETNGLRIVVYIGNAGETYSGADFAGRSAREILNGGSIWQKNKSGDKFTRSVPLSPTAISAFLENNKGESIWPDAWQPSATPGRWLKRTADKSRLAVAHGTLDQQLYQVEVRMVDDLTRAQD